MTITARLYRSLPSFVQPIARRTYRSIHPNETSIADIRQSKQEFVSSYFDSEKEYEGYLAELNEKPISDLLQQATETADKYRDSTELENRYFHKVYAYVRKTEPEIIVETV
jgi:hypothetical protein